jgi:hypothetical protein
MKIRRYAIPKGIAAPMGTSQWIKGRAVQPSQKRLRGRRGAARQARGRRRNSSRWNQGGWRWGRREATEAR